MGKNKRFTPQVANEPSKQIDPEPEKILESNEIIIHGIVEEVDGMVDGVQLHLNVRSTPEVKADNVLTILKKGTNVKVIDPKKTEEGSGEKWLKIRIIDKKPENEITGYAMKKYIKMI